MKKSTHYLLKFLVLTLFFNLTNCSKDEDYQINEQEVNSESKVLVKKISRQEVYSNPVLANNLSKYCGEKSNNQIKGEEYSNANSKIIYNSDLNIAINDQVANFLQSTDGSYHSYTFNVINYNDLSAKSNLLLSLQPDGSYLEVLINYDLSDQQLEAFNTTGLLPENVEITSQLLENGTFTTSLFAKTLVLGTECGGIEYGNVNSSICTAGGNHVWTQRFDCQGYPGPTGPTPGSDYTVSFDLDCLIENAGSDSTLDSDTTSEGENQEQEDNGGVLDGPNNLDNPNDEDNDENYNPEDINIHGNGQSVPLFDGSYQTMSGPFTSFLNGLSPDLQDFINSPSNIFIKINVGDFLRENGYTNENENLAIDIINSAINNTLVTPFPFFRFPVGNNYENDFPKFTEYVKNQIPTLKDNITIINAIKTYTNLTTEEVKSAFEFGKGPIIEIAQLDNFPNCSICDSATLGHFNGATDANKFYIDIDLIMDLENTAPGSSLADAFAFLIGVTLLHEYVHLGDNLDGIDYEGEEGLLFEQDVYGQSVWRDNAETILKQN